MKDNTHGPAPGFLRLWWAMRTSFFLFLLFLFATVFSAIGVSSQWEADLFETHGKVAQAEVIGRRVARVFEDEKWDTKYFVTFRYDASGQVYTVEKAVQVGSYDDLTESAKHEIRFLRDDPSRFEVHVGESRKLAQLSRWIGLVFWFAALIMLLWTTARVRRALLARRYGNIEKARVLGVINDSGSSQLRWIDLRGGTGESMHSRSARRYHGYPIDAEVTVFRDSKGKTWWVGDVGPRKAAPTVPSVGKR